MRISWSSFTLALLICFFSVTAVKADTWYPNGDTADSGFYFVPAMAISALPNSPKLFYDRSELIGEIDSNYAQNNRITDFLSGEIVLEKGQQILAPPGTKVTVNIFWGNDSGHPVTIDGVKLFLSSEDGAQNFQRVGAVGGFYGHVDYAVNTLQVRRQGIYVKKDVYSTVDANSNNLPAGVNVYEFDILKPLSLSILKSKPFEKDGRLMFNLSLEAKNNSQYAFNELAIFADSAELTKFSMRANETKLLSFEIEDSYRIELRVNESKKECISVATSSPLGLGAASHIAFISRSDESNNWFRPLPNLFTYGSGVRHFCVGILPHSLIEKIPDELLPVSEELNVLGEAQSIYELDRNRLVESSGVSLYIVSFSLVTLGYLWYDHCYGRKRV